VLDAPDASGRAKWSNHRLTADTRQMSREKLGFSKLKPSIRFTKGF